MDILIEGVGRIGILGIEEEGDGTGASCDYVDRVRTLQMTLKYSMIEHVSNP